MAFALVFALGSSPALAQDFDALQALGDRAALSISQIHKQLRPYDRALQMRVARGAVTTQQAAGLLKQKGEELARGAASASQLQAEERQEAEAFFAAVLQATARSTRWPVDKPPAYYKTYAESMVEEAREMFKTMSAAGRSTEPALGMAYRALALARGDLVQVATPFRDTDRRIATSIDLPQAAALQQPPGVASSDIPVRPVAPAQRGQAVGCFRDTNAPFDLDGFLERSNQNTPARCISVCESKGFRYAGVQYGQSCLCGNSYGRYGQADNCTMACTGNGAEICGGINSNNVYRTGR